jgi:hypothetical protein
VPFVLHLGQVEEHAVVRHELVRLGEFGERRVEAALFEELDAPSKALSRICHFRGLGGLRLRLSEGGDRAEQQRDEDEG